MKNILITGKKGYIGNAIFEFLRQYPNDYFVERIDLRNPNWLNYDFSKVDTVIHLAAIVHKKENRNMERVYFDVNSNLTRELALISKKNGVSHFIFMSSMSVYGNQKGEIRLDTLPQPNTLYGKSKLLAEEYIESLNCKDFIVTILRPPLVYGFNCGGNYKKLRNVVLKFPFFIKIENKRSAIFINNLVYSIDAILKNRKPGVILPQNKEYMSTLGLVREICRLNGKKLHEIRCFSTLIDYLIKIRLSKQLSSLFGNLYYAEDAACVEYSRVSFEESVYVSEKGS